MRMYAGVRVFTTMKRVLAFATATVLAVATHAAPPELSAEEPIVYDGQTQSLVARGNAVFAHESFRVEADEVLYNQAEQQAVATGNVRLTRPGFRLVTERLVYNVTTRKFDVGKFRAGYPPVFIEGEKGSGTADELTLDNVVIHLGEPDVASPNVSAEQVILRPNDRVIAVGARPGIGPFRLFRIPNYSRELVALPALRFRGEGGYRGNLGAYIRGGILMPTNENLFLGGNLDLYSERGVLFGPSLEYSGEVGGSEMHTRLNTGWIADQGSLGQDYFLRDIPQQRYFAELQHKQRVGERLFFTADATWLSDPEVLRDFRPEVFDANHYPNAVVEASYHFDNVIVSALTRFETGGDYAQVERLPELRIDLLTTPLFAGIYQTGYANAALTTYSIADEPEEETSYVHAYYGLRRPVFLTDWLTLTPRVGGMYAHYSDALWLDDTGSRFGTPVAADHVITELGADLIANFHAEWDYRNDFWGIQGLRHTLRPVARWRHYEASGDTGLYPAGFISGDYYVQMPPIEMRDWMGDDALALDGLHFVRMGVENVLQTRPDKGSGSRTLASLNLYQDYDLEASDWDQTFVQLQLSPAEFIDLSYENGFYTDGPSLNFSRLRLGLRSGNAWRFDLYTDYLSGTFDDYVGQFFYQATNDWGVILSLGYDARNSEFDRQAVTLVQQIGSFWQVRYSVTHNADARREDDWGLSVAVRLSRF